MATFTANIDGITLSRKSKRAFTHGIVEIMSVAALRQRVANGQMSQDWFERLMAELPVVGDKMYNLWSCTSSLELAQKAHATAPAGSKIVELVVA